MPDAKNVPIAPASTVVLLRDRLDSAGVEALLLRRSAQLAFHGGAWVFPGGRVDADDAAEGEDLFAEPAARRAAVREANEEAGVVLAGDEMVPIAHWTTPLGPPRRFSTWFFAAAVGHGEDHTVAIDGTETTDHAWWTPEQALERRAAGDIELPPPTFVTLRTVQPYRSATDAVDALRALPAAVFVPKIVAFEGGSVCLYAGDSGYDTADPAAPRPHHRLHMGSGLADPNWRYVRD